MRSEIRTCGLGCGWYSPIGEGKGTCFNFNHSYSVNLKDPCMHGLKKGPPLMEPFHSLTPIGRERMIKTFLSICNSNPASPSGTLEECEFSTP